MKDKVKTAQNIHILCTGELVAVCAHYINDGVIKIKEFWDCQFTSQAPTGCVL